MIFDVIVLSKTNKRHESDIDLGHVYLYFCYDEILKQNMVRKFTVVATFNEEIFPEPFTFFSFEAYMTI